MKYNIQFRLAPHIKDMLKEDYKNTPFCFKFDETTTSQIKKQDDGSLFSSMVTESAEDLLDHFFHFMKNLNLDNDFLISISMDGPNVNKSFEKKLQKCFNEKGATSFLSLGSCPLHSSHNGFRQGFKSFECDVDQFACDLYYFF